jgi:hypothetical protein
MAKGLTIQISNNAVQSVNGSRAHTDCQRSRVQIQSFSKNPLMGVLAATAAWYLTTVGVLAAFNKSLHYFDTLGSWKADISLDILRQISTDDLIKELLLDLSQKSVDKEPWKILYKALNNIRIALIAYAILHSLYSPVQLLKLNFLFSYVYSSERISEKIKRLEFLEKRITEFLTSKYHALHS